MAEIKAYQEAGVNVEAGYESTRLIREDVKKTLTAHVLSELGGFGGMVALPEGYRQPVLISGTDGVGTKLMLAISQDIHDTVGIDAVAMCVNDIICQGAEPLFFLDYIACGKNEPTRIAEIVRGVADGCVQAECALVGGETAEMPGMYDANDYDIAGFAVGVAEKDDVITGAGIKAGDALVGIASSGVHSNGFSLVRKVLRDNEIAYDTFVPELDTTVGKALLTPTIIYVKALKGLHKEYELHGISNITGGGFYENIPRMLPEGLCANVHATQVQVLPVFKYLQRLGNLSEEAMYSTFNMGVGLVAALPNDKADGFISELVSRGYNAYRIGDVTQNAQEQIIIRYNEEA